MGKEYPCASASRTKYLVPPYRPFYLHAPKCLTFVAIPHSAKINVVLVIGEEKEAEPGVNSIDGHNEENPDYIALLIGAAVAAQVHVDLGGRRKLGSEQHTGLSKKEKETGTLGMQAQASHTCCFNNSRVYTFSSEYSLDFLPSEVNFLRTERNSYYKRGLQQNAEGHYP